METLELINEFLESLEVERGRAKNTIDAYRLYLERFYELPADFVCAKPPASTTLIW